MKGPDCAGYDGRKDRSIRRNETGGAESMGEREVRDPGLSNKL